MLCQKIHGNPQNSTESHTENLDWLHSAKTCDAGWRDWAATEWCYLLVLDAKSYLDAQAHCESLNAGLAQVLSQQENNFLSRKSL